ncbi:MAG: hypothetical protein N2747_07620 [Chitinophagaceae bacterium]|nr:hypothetical protein [Chitinophagaceae bacterium]
MLTVISSLKGCAGRRANEVRCAAAAPGVGMGDAVWQFYLNGAMACAAASTATPKDGGLQPMSGLARRRRHDDSPKIKNSLFSTFKKVMRGTTAEFIFSFSVAD